MNWRDSLRRAFLASLFVCGAAPPVQAGRILLVSWSNSPDPLEDAHIRSDTHADDPLVTFLESSGHVVDTSGMGQNFGGNPFNDPAQLAALNNADLILFSNVLKSGLYGGERVEWNGFGKPILALSGWVIRGGTAGGLSRWGWINDRMYPDPGTANTAEPAETVQIAAGRETHPFVGGLQAATRLWDWSGMPGEVSPWAPRAVDNGSYVVPGGVVVGTLDGRPMLIDYPKGTDFDDPDEFGNPQNGPPQGNASLRYGTAGARRAFLSDWGYHCTHQACAIGTYDFDDGRTQAYRDLVAQVIDEMIAHPYGLIVGDMDLDGDTDFDDIDDFVLGLISPANYELTFGLHPANVGDTNGDGDQDFDDIPQFVGLFTGSGTADRTLSVPEPATAFLLLAAAGLAGPGGRQLRGPG